MTKIIGHRGAAGLALENTLASFRVARDLGVDAIEFDVQVTRDGKFVVCHDGSLSRVSKSLAIIKNSTYAKLKKLQLYNGEHLPLLTEVLRAVGDTPVIVEIKITGHTEAICKILDQFPQHDITVASFHHNVIGECRKLRPQMPALLAEDAHPLSILPSARRQHATGLDLNYKILNPLTYWLANRAGLQIMVYTVDSRLAVWLIQRLYPRVWICTNHPERFIKQPAIEAAEE